MTVAEIFKAGLEFEEEDFAEPVQAEIVAG
jgi:hypothetical protein